MPEYDKYKSLAETRATPNDISLAAKADGVGFMERLKLVRQIFGLSPAEGKEVTIIADGLGTSLSDYQAKLIPAIKEAARIAEQPDQ